MAEFKEKLKALWEKIKPRLIRFGKAVLNYIKQAKIELILLVAALAFDLVFKGIIESTMYEGQTIELIPNFLNFHFIYNPFAAFGGAFGLEKLLGSDAIRIIFIIITFLAVGVFGFFLYRGRGKSLLMRVSLALIMAGALGNLYDRLFIGQVRDFVQIVYFGLDIPWLGGRTFAIFNIADAELTVGVVAFLVYFIFFYRDPKSEKNKAAEKGQAVAVEGAEESEDVINDNDEAEPKTAGIGQGGGYSTPKEEEGSEKGIISTETNAFERNPQKEKSPQTQPSVNSETESADRAESVATQAYGDASANEKNAASSDK